MSNGKSDHHYDENGKLERTERQLQLIADLEKTAKGGPEEIAARKARFGRVPSFIAHNKKLHDKHLEQERAASATADESSNG